MIFPFGSTARKVPAGVARLGSHSVVAVRSVVVAFEKISFPINVLLSERAVELAMRMQEPAPLALSETNALFAEHGLVPA